MRFAHFPQGFDVVARLLSLPRRAALRGLLCLGLAATGTTVLPIGGFALEAPKTIAIQGLLTSNAGLPVADGDYGLSVQFYDAQAAVVPLYKELIIGVQVKSGLFSATVGQNLALDLSIFQTGTAQWVGVTVGSEPELPRQRLQWTPYALRASYAAAAASVDCSGCIAGAQIAPEVLAPYAKSADLALVAKSGKYGDLSGQPDLSVFAQVAALAKVATSGNYADLQNLPALSKVALSGAYADLSGTPQLANVAMTGNYADLNGTVVNGALTGKYDQPLQMTNAANAFAGDGTGLINVPAAKLSGTIGAGQLGAGVVSDVHVNAAAAIAGSKIAPDFGAQNIVTAGSVGIGVASPAAKLDVNGDVRVSGNVYGPVGGGYRIQSTEWVNISGAGCGSNPVGYMKLVTPIVENESNMFSIKVVFYGYAGGGYAGEIRCGGYAYSASTLINAGCTGWGVSLPYTILVEKRSGKNVVVVRIGDAGTGWYYQHFTYDYVGWQPHPPATFQWVCGEKS